MNRYIQYAADKIQGKPEGLRSSKWPAVEKAHLQKEPVCQWCGSVKALNVHHVQPFHVKPKLELTESNLITLCRSCHFVQGHYCNWKLFDKYVKKICSEYRKTK